jgi:CubicO group peptidase (beta-lactamase class C family)
VLDSNARAAQTGLGRGNDTVIVAVRKGYIREMVKWVLFALALPLAADSFDSVRASIRKSIEGGQVPSIAVAVARDGKIIWEEGFGMADREKKRASTPNTLYSLASISKPITATGLMILKERGKIDLDRPINTYLGESKLKGWAWSADEATVRRVANHTSGLPLHYQFFYVDEPYRRPAMDETIRRYGNLVTKPGETYEYSNLGYGVIDYVISRISGKPYKQFMREEVFEPLGLKNMSVDIVPGREAEYAARYATDGSPIPFYDFDHPGGSAVWASAHDLVRFGMFHLKEHLPDQKRILSDSAIDEMHTATAPIRDKVGYGVGWQVSDSAGYRIISHTGGMGGVTTILNLVPSRRIAVAVLANGTGPAVGRVSSEIADALGLARQQGGGGQNEPRGPDFTGRWSGTIHTYKADLPLLLDFKGGADIHARIGQQLWTLVNQVRWENSTLQGRFKSDIGTDDANRRPYTLRLVVKMRGDVLNGSVTAMSDPASKPGNALSHWVQLKKE